MRVDNSMQEIDQRIVFKGESDQSIALVIEKARSNGWKSISVQGNSELCRATWFEAKMAGLEVSGYKPSREDRELLKGIQHQTNVNAKTSLSAKEIVSDYNMRVVPHLQKRYKDLRRKRSKLGITTTDLDRAYGVNQPTGYAKGVDEQFYDAKVRLSRAIEDRDYFLAHGSKQMPVKFTYEDGVARYVVKENTQSLSRGRK